MNEEKEETKKNEHNSVYCCVNENQSKQIFRLNDNSDKEVKRQKTKNKKTSKQTNK